MEDGRIIDTICASSGEACAAQSVARGAGFESSPPYLTEMRASIRRAAAFAAAEREAIAGVPGSFLSGALGFAVRTISGEIVGELVAVVPSSATAGPEVVIAHGLLGRHRHLPAELVLGANAAERVVILNLGPASALDQLGSRPSTAKAPPRRAEPLDDTASTHLLFLPVGGGYDLVVRQAALPPASEAIELEGQRYRIAKVGRSPLPHDPRPCLYLLAEPRPDQTSSVSTQPMRPRPHANAPSGNSPPSPAQVAVRTPPSQE